MRRLAGFWSAALIHHGLTDCIPLKAQHANTISSTAGHLTSTSLTRLHANSITANAGPLTNTSVMELEILRLCRNAQSHTVALRQSHTLFRPRYFCSSAANALICLRREKVVLIRLCSAHNTLRLSAQASIKGSHSNTIMISYFTKSTRMIFN